MSPSCTFWVTVVDIGEDGAMLRIFFARGRYNPNPNPNTNPSPNPNPNLAL